MKPNQIAKCLIAVLLVHGSCTNRVEPPKDGQPFAELTDEESVAVDAFARAFLAKPGCAQLGVFVRGEYPSRALLDAWKADELPIVAGRDHSGSTILIRSIGSTDDGSLIVRADEGGRCRDFWSGIVTETSNGWSCEVSYEGVGCIDP